MYRSNRSFSMPPRATPRAFDFFENYCSSSPLPGPKCRSNAPHWGPFRWSNAPTPGTFHRYKNDRRTAETPSLAVVEQNLYKYNKNWETALAYLLRTKVSCKAAEIAATRSLNAHLFFVMQHTKRSIKKSHLLRLLHHEHFTDMHHRSPYTSNWPLLSFLLLYWIAGNRYCISL